MDPDKSGQGYKQIVDLNKSSNYLLEFEYSTRPGISLKENSFSVFFNGEEVVRIRPGKQGREKVRKEVYGKKGENILEFLDEGVEIHYGCGIDNVGLYEIRVIID